VEADFAHSVERELARVFDEVGIAWEYEPTTFVLERKPDGSVAQAFTPDFYLPEQDMYVEVTTMQQKLTSRKNQKLRRLREQGVLVTVLYRRDFERLRERHGFPFDIAGTRSPEPARLLRSSRGE
jgi:hypoxanthine phosphoribosyltransferase